MIPSIIINALIVVFFVGACVTALRQAEQKRVAFRFFTVLSNMFCAVAALAMMFFSITGEVPTVVRILKYSGTCAVTVTFLTVMLFLLPTMKDPKRLLIGHNLFLHVLCPILAIISWLAFEKTGDLSFYIVIFGTLPVILYTGLYIYKVLLAPPGKRWEDFYGFNRNGKWPISAVAMICSAFIISVLLWVI